jgi:hypothetical protein
VDRIEDGNNGGRSLCDKYLGLGKADGLKDENDNSPDNCAACKKKF